MKTIEIDSVLLSTLLAMKAICFNEDGSYLDAFKQQIATAVHNGTHVPSLAKEIDIPTQTINKWHRRFYSSLADIGLDDMDIGFVFQGRILLPDDKTKGFILKSLRDKQETVDSLAKTFHLSVNTIRVWEEQYKDFIDLLCQLPNGTKMQLYTKGQQIYGLKEGMIMKRLLREHIDKEKIEASRLRAQYAKEKADKNK